MAAIQAARVLRAGRSTDGPAPLTETEKSDLATIRVSGRYKAAIIARNLSMDVNDFDRYNPGFDQMLATGETYDLQLPTAKMALFAGNKYSILNECVQQLLGSAVMNKNAAFNKKK